MKNKAIDIFLNAVESVKPKQMIHTQIEWKDGLLKIGENNFPMYRYEHIYLLAAGKAAAQMAEAMEEILGDKITEGIVITKYGHATPLMRSEVIEAGHPIPDAAGVAGMQKFTETAEKAAEKDLVICLISGGASALMADLPENITLDELRLTNDLLVKSGADISEINCIRKHLSKIKGGQLANIIYPATTVTLILSDVVGDQIDVIASGPTAPDSTTFSEAIAIVHKYRLTAQLPRNITNYLKAGNAGRIPETPKSDNPVFQKVYNFVIGNNQKALEAASKRAEELGFESYLITDALQEDLLNVAEFIIEKTAAYQEKSSQTPVCLLFGGEPTVKVTGNGTGGRNQHLALYLASRIQEMKGITILCAGTDGTDGPTDAAGAVVDCNTYQSAKNRNIDPDTYLTAFDSYHFFKAVGGLLTIGNSGTNVMDLCIVLIN